MPSDGLVWVLRESMCVCCCLFKYSSGRSLRVPMYSLCFPDATFSLNARRRGVEPWAGNLRWLNLVHQCLLHWRTGFSFLKKLTEGRVSYFRVTYFLKKCPWCDLCQVMMKILSPPNLPPLYTPSIAWRLQNWNRQVLGMKALIYLPHLFFIFVALVSVFLYDDFPIWFPGPVFNLRVDVLVGAAGRSRCFLWFFF